MAESLNILVICGSLRKGSYNAALARALPEFAPPGVTFTTAPTYDTMPMYNEDLQNASGFPPAAEAFAAAIRGADGVIIVSPEYNWTIPGALKNALDWVSRMKDQPFVNKPVAIQSCSQGPMGGSRMQYHLRQSLVYLKAFTFGVPEVIVSVAQNKFDKDMKLTDEQTRKFVQQQLEGFAKFIARVRA